MESSSPRSQRSSECVVSSGRQQLQHTPLSVALSPCPRPAGRYEGPNSTNPLAFRYYNAEEEVLGKKMKDW